MNRAVFLLVLFLGSGCIFAEILVYKESSKDRIRTYKISIDRAEDGYIISCDLLGVVNECRTDANFSILSWNYSNQDKKIDLIAQRSGRRIGLKGKISGKDVEKEYQIDDFPWFQYWGLGLKSLPENSKGKMFFWCIQPLI